MGSVIFGPGMPFVRGWEAIQAWRGRWAELGRRSAPENPFASPDWIEAWWSTLGAKREPLLWIWEDRGELRAVAALSRSRAPFRRIAGAGAGVSDYFPLWARAGDEPEARERLLEELAREYPHDVVDLGGLRPDPERPARPGMRVVAQDRCLVLELPSRFGDYVEGLSKSLRYEVRRPEREPYRSGRARLISPGSVDEALALLDDLFRLHGKRWRRRGAPGSFATRRVREMHREYARRAFDAGGVSLLGLEYEGRTIGAILLLLAERTTFFYQSGFDPEFRALSPGTVLVGEAIRRTIERGGTHFDFLRGDEAYKRRWKPQHAFTLERWVLPPARSRFSPGLWVTLAGSRLERDWKRRWAGRGLLR